MTLTEEKTKSIISEFDIDDCSILLEDNERIVVRDVENHTEVFSADISKGAWSVDVVQEGGIRKFRLGTADLMPIPLPRFSTLFDLSIESSQVQFHRIDQGKLLALIGTEDFRYEGFFTNSLHRNLQKRYEFNLLECRIKLFKTKTLLHVECQREFNLNLNDSKPGFSLTKEYIS